MKASLAALTAGVKINKRWQNALGMAYMDTVMIKNASKGIVISEAARLCTSRASKIRGLMFSQPKDLVFAFKEEQPISLHMLFVFFPIDVVFLNSEMRVTGLRKGAMPFASLIRGHGKYVLELRAGTIARTKVGVGDGVEIRVSANAYPEHI